MQVYVDGGIRRGTDIFKCMALGANGVGIGRPTLYGLACHGERGVEHVLNLLNAEFQFCMASCGCTSMEQINDSFVIKRSSL